MNLQDLIELTRFTSSINMQFEDYNETEILSLMLNKDEFIQYITQQYNNKNVCTRLHPIIWAIHFNIPKRQRLQILENILHQNMMYVRTYYSFLPENQMVGKTYKILGIPTICGKPNNLKNNNCLINKGLNSRRELCAIQVPHANNRCFLTAYKKYKSFYPVRYTKNEKPAVFNNSVNHNSIETETSMENSNGYSAKRIINSTPKTKTIQHFKMNPLLSPIKISIEKRCPSLSTNSFYTDSDLNMQNITQNNIINNYSIQISPKTKKQESSFNIHNTSQQTLHDVDIQNTEKTDTESLNYSQSQMYFISRDPKYIQTENDISRLDEHDLSDVWNEKSSNIKTEYTDNNMSVYLENSKCIKYEKFSTVDQAGETSYTSKQRINERLQPNQKNNSIPSPLIDNKIERESIEQGCNDTWERDMSDWSMDTAAQRYNIEKNVMTFSESTPSKEPNDWSSDREKNTSCNTSDMSWSNIVCSNSTNGSYQINAAVKRKFLEWSDKSVDSNNDEGTSTKRKEI